MQEYYKLKDQPFPRIRGAYQKTPRKVLRERLKKVPITQTNRPGFRDGSRGGFVCRRRGQGQFLRPCAFWHFRENAQTKSRQCRGKEEESDTACCIGTPEHCGLVRRDLVVCPPFWLLPRIETGDSFFMGLLCAAAAAAPAGNCACMGFCGENLSEVMGDVRSVLPECTLIMPDNRGNSLW